MVLSGPPTPIGGTQSVSPSLLRSNSGMLLRGQGSAMGSQGGFPSLVSPRTQFNNVNLLGNVPNVSPLLNNHSFGNGGPRSGIDSGADSDHVSGIGGSGMGFNPNPPSSSFSAGNMTNPGSSTQFQTQQFPNSSGNQIIGDQPQAQAQQVAGVVGVKMEPQDQHGAASQQQQQLQSLRGIAANQVVKLEPQQLQSMRGIGPVKMEPQPSDQSLLLQQQQHQLLQQMRQSSPQAAAAHISILQQQRLLQLQQQQQQQQQLLRAIPHQRSQLQPQLQLPPHNLPRGSPVKPLYEPGMCARRLTQYMYQQQHRPEDNNIEFWRKFVSDYFAPNAKKKWCVSMYGSGRQTNGVFPQDVWHCEICKRKPGRGFEATVEVLPRLFKIKYESGTLEELLYVDMPREYQNSSGQIVLDYAKAIQESVFDQLRVVRDGQLRIVFSPDLKICSWEFCARRHEELIPRRLLTPQVTQLGAAAQKYQAATQNLSVNMSTSDLQSNCNVFVASARQLAKALEVPLVNDLGYTKRYVRCLQISEVVNSMKDLIDYSRLKGVGPMETLAKFSRTSASSGAQGQNQQPDEEQQQQPQQQQQQQQLSQQTMTHNLNNNEKNSGQSGPMQGSNGGPCVNNTPTSQSNIFQRNSMNSRPQNCNANSPYGGSSLQMPSPGSSSTMQQTQPIPTTPSNAPETSHGTLAAHSPAISNIQQPALSGEGDTTDTQSSVQKIIHEMMMNSSQLSSRASLMGIAGSLGNDVKNVSLNGGSVGNNGPINSSSSTMGGITQASMINGMRPSMADNNPIPMGMMNARVGIPSMVRDQSMSHQQDFGNQMLSGLGAVNGFNNLQFDWKTLP